MKKKISLIRILLLFCFIASVLRAGDVPHLVGGTVRLEDGSLIESVQCNASVFTRPDDVLTEKSPGCKYEDGYYWVQCGSFASNWKAGELLIIEVYDANGHRQEKSVTLTYASLDTLNFILPFIRYDYTFQTEPAGLPVWIDGIEHMTPAVFSWLENSEHTVSIVSPQLESSASRHVFHVWNHGEAQDHTITSTAHSMITAYFVPEFKLFMNVDPAQAGTVNINPQKIWYADNELVQLQAFPNNSEGYIFSGWTGDIATSSNPLTITMDQSYSVTANFQIRGIQVEVNPSPSNAGFIMLEPYKESYQFGDTLLIQAVANEGSGYFFHEWKGDITGFQNPHQIVLYQDLSATAVFRTKRYDLNISVEPFLSGAVDLDPYNANYAYGDTVAITAVPMEGYKFFFWEGDHFSLKNPDTLIITGPMEITANFRIYTRVDEKQKNHPAEFRLNKNYPNPFNLSTMISLEIPESCEIELTVYNALGRKITVLLEGKVNAGFYDILWNAVDAKKDVLKSGVYILRCKTGQNIHQIKMMLLK